MVMVYNSFLYVVFANACFAHWFADVMFKEFRIHIHIDW